jgi:hypothetical protein
MKVTDREYALALDRNDSLAHFRERFLITDPELCYLDGNSLGRMPHETVKRSMTFSPLNGAVKLSLAGATGSMKHSQREIYWGVLYLVPARTSSRL